MPEAVFAGIDLDAESGRVVVGRLEGGRASVDLMGGTCQCANRLLVAAEPLRIG